LIKGLNRARGLGTAASSPAECRAAEYDLKRLRETFLTHAKRCTIAYRTLKFSNYLKVD